MLLLNYFPFNWTTSASTFNSTLNHSIDLLTAYFSISLVPLPWPFLYFHLPPRLSCSGNFSLFPVSSMTNFTCKPLFYYNHTFPYTIHLIDQVIKPSLQLGNYMDGIAVSRWPCPVLLDYQPWWPVTWGPSLCYLHIILCIYSLYRFPAGWPFTC